MKRVILIVGFLFIGISSGFCSTELTYENFKAEVAGKKILVEFYSPDCPHCQKMEAVIPEFEKMTSTVIGKINVRNEPKLAQDFGVKSWPTFIVFEASKEKGRFMGETPLPVLLSKFKNPKIELPKKRPSPKNGSITIGIQFADKVWLSCLFITGLFFKRRRHK